MWPARVFENQTGPPSAFTIFFLDMIKIMFFQNSLFKNLVHDPMLSLVPSSTPMLTLFYFIILSSAPAPVYPSLLSMSLIHNPMLTENFNFNSIHFDACSSELPPGDGHGRRVSISLYPDTSPLPAQGFSRILHPSP